MSKYEQLQKRKSKSFKRLIGVNAETFEKMIEIFKAYEKERTKKHGIGGRKTLCPEDKVLLMLSYYREYRTLEHIGFDYGVSEATASRVVRNVEDVLIKSGAFSLPSKRALYTNEVNLEFIVIDATESPIHRPKKSNESTTQVKSDSTP
jgi:hypothetical protein